MRTAIVFVAMLFAANLVGAQLDEVEVPVPTGELPAPIVEPPVEVPNPFADQDPEEPRNESLDPADPPHDYQSVIWSDGRAAPLPDGLDLLELRMWEADLPAGSPVEGPGMMLRLHLAGGSVAGLYDQHLIAGGIYVVEEDAVPRNITLLLNEDGWSSADTYVAATTTTNGTEIIPSMLSEPMDHVVHLFVPLADLGALPGDLVGGWTFVAQGHSSQEGVAATQFDSAPDGALLIRGGDDPPNTTVEQKAGPTYFIRGAGQHLEVEGMWDADVASFTVTNPYATPQQVYVQYPSGTEATSAVAQELPANGTVSFDFDAPRGAEAMTLQWAFRSDIHALATMELDLPALPPEPTPAPEPIAAERTDVVVAPPEPADAMDDAMDDGMDSGMDPEVGDEPAGEDSPVGVWLVLVAVAMAGIVRRLR